MGDLENEVISKKIDLDCEEDVKPQMSFTKFSIPSIKKDEKGSKEFNMPFGWTKFSDEECFKRLKNGEKRGHKVFCVLTGKRNNITVFDFDKPGLYESFIEKYPEFKKAYTIKTSRGFHIYCKYNPLYKTSKDTGFGMDTRNDGGMSFGNGTKTEYGTSYVLLDNDNLKLDMEFPEEWCPDSLKKLPPKPAKKTTKKLVLKKSVENNTTPFAEKVLQLIKPEIIDEMNNFQRIVWAMKNEGFSVADVEKVAAKSQHYDKDTYTSWFAKKMLWESKTNKNSCKLGTLIHFAKLSDEKKFYDLYIQHNSSSDVNTSDIALAKTYLEIIGDNLFYQDRKLYIYLENEWVCDEDGFTVKNNFLEEMQKYYLKMKDEVKKEIDEIDDPQSEEGEEKMQSLIKREKTIKGCKAHIEKVQTLTNIISAIKTLMAGNRDEIVFDTNEEQLYNIQFKNGVFDLNTNEFRQRTKDDYISLYLSWDYDPESITEEARSELKECFEKIEPHPERRKCLLSYLAYSLTGDCSKQKYINLVGYSAANGKSHTFKMMNKCFEFYTKKLTSHIFNVGNEKRHKEIIHLHKKPVRFAYIEELDNKKKLDAEYMKDIVDGDKVPIEVMYGTSVDVKLQAKIATSSNGDPNIKMDSAILRRMVNIYLTSQFVDIEEDDWDNRKFVRKNGAEKMFDCPIMKNAVFELLTRSEYKEFVVPDCVKEETKDTADLLNEFKDKFEEEYEITKNPEDLVNKADFMDVMKISRTDLKKVISEMRQIGVDYNKSKKKHNVKGCFVGMREKPPDPKNKECQVPLN